MFNGIALTHIITIYYTVRTMYGIYISYQFLSWLLVSTYGIGYGYFIIYLNPLYKFLIERCIMK